MTKSAVDLSKDEFFSAAYEELRRVARTRYGGLGSLTWNPTAIVNEVYIRIAQSKRFQPASPEHLKHTIIRVMRYILVEAARRKQADRRGGGSAPIRQIPLDEAAAETIAFDPNEILSLDLVLDELARHSEFQARIFEYQFFGGLQVAEIAGMVGTSEKKVQRGLRLAKAFLTVALSRGNVE